jgi:hypothetical protein
VRTDDGTLTLAQRSVGSYPKRRFSPAFGTSHDRELTERFGGVTAFTSAPAQGLWISEGGTTHDEIVVVEVMTSDLDREWWASYRARLEMLLKQKHIVFRAQSIVLL